VRRALLALIVLGLAARTARAFPTGAQFDFDPVAMDGGGGIAFDGAPRWTSHTCAVCHTDAPGRIGIRLEADEPALFTDGWVAKQQYHLRVVLDGEWAGLAYAAAGDMCGFATSTYVPCDQNGFALELADGGGQPVGKLVPVAEGACVNSGTPPPDVDAYIFTDGTAAAHTGAHAALTQWDVCWTAPAAGAGTITAYVAVVDGNGGDGTEAFPNDTKNDDVAAGAVSLFERGGTPVTQGGGCDAAGAPGLGAALALGLLAIRRNRRARLAALLAAAATLGGCAHVRATQREVLAQKKMQFSPDPAEDELDLHMQEAREGSQGGYGSSGGGCGCN
jgi:uncharacterized protein (TIGR03382 family)